MATDKIQIRNVKTGKISLVTSTAWKLLKAGGQSKGFDVIDQPIEQIVHAQVNAPIQEKKDVLIDAPVAEPNKNTDTDEELSQTKAAELIGKIDAAKSTEEVDALIQEGESRSTVLKAAQKKKAELK